jgi:ParB family transcriptional regulator, chromosome partitioning protein
MAQSKSRLGRGLGALIAGGVGGQKAAPAKPVEKAKQPPREARPQPSKPEPVAETKAAKPPPQPVPAVAGFREIPVKDVEPNPRQPRRTFAPDQLQELAESIRSEGLLQPIVVRSVNGRFELIAGERRWRAFQLLKLKSIPARLVEANDFSSASMAMIENLQRENLNPVEEAYGYASLIRDFNLTQESVAERVGKGRATVANALRLLQLEAEIQGYLGTGLLSPGHAKALLGLESKEQQALLARRIIEEGLSVRSAERLVQSAKEAKSSSSSSARSAPAAERTALADIEKRLGSYFNARVALKHSPKRGKILIEYLGNEDLQRILEKLGVGS